MDWYRMESMEYMEQAKEREREEKKMMIEMELEKMSHKNDSSKIGVK
jgi:hypothetical protein